MKTNPTQTVEDPKNATLEILVDFFLHMAITILKLVPNLRFLIKLYGGTS